MKKLIIAAVAVATLASCSKNDKLALAKADDGAISFCAYSSTAVTRGGTVAKTDVIATDKGIGVFAFYQPANVGNPVNFNSRNFIIPDFMYNQQVKPVFESGSTTEVNHWEYTPVKYWPNNKGDQVSFFAYAPYNPEKTWDDQDLKTDINATKLTTSFSVSAEKSMMVDYLFATPVLNRSKQQVNLDASEQISFYFRHIMSRIAINVGVVVDKLPSHSPQPWTDPKTKITVESIALKGIAESYDYLYTIGTKTESWKANGSQDLMLTESDFKNNTSDSWTTANWNPLLADEKGNPGFLFIAPQDLSNANVDITYRVDTTDPLHPANCSSIKVVVSRKIGVNFESGKAYTLDFLIGLKSTEFSVTMVDWDEVTPATQIDVPANEPGPLN